MYFKHKFCLMGPFFVTFQCLSNVNSLLMWQKNKELGVAPIIMVLHMHDLLIIIRNYMHYYYTLITLNKNIIILHALLAQTCNKFLGHFYNQLNIELLSRKIWFLKFIYLHYFIWVASNVIKPCVKLIKTRD